jgi:hypothetical protein
MGKVQAHLRKQGPQECECEAQQAQQAQQAQAREAQQACGARAYLLQALQLWRLCQISDTQYQLGEKGRLAK